MILSYHAVPTEEEMFFIGSTLRRLFFYDKGAIPYGGEYPLFSR